MIQWIIKILQNFSVYKLGWYREGFQRVFDWEIVAIIVLVMLSILAAVNIIYFLFKGDNMYMKVYIPLCIFYVVSNIIMNFLLILLFLSLGPTMWIIFMVAYGLFLAIHAGVTAENYDDFPGIFGFAAFVVQYSKKYKKYINHKESMQRNYERFLNIKYE
jgi:hypothetical protein